MTHNSLPHRAAMTHTLSHRTATTTRFSSEKVGCQKRRHQVLPTVRSVGPFLASTHQMEPPKWGRTHLMMLCYSFIDPERMKGWVTLCIIMCALLVWIEFCIDLWKIWYVCLHCRAWEKSDTWLGKAWGAESCWRWAMGSFSAVLVWILCLWHK